MLSGVAGGWGLGVVFVLTRGRDLALPGDARGEALPVRYFGVLGAWTALGVPALLAFLAIFWLMVAKPVP